MKIQSVKQINITVLFPEPLNHALISIPELRKSLAIGKENQDKASVVEAPGLKVLILPNRKREIVFERNRILINIKEPKDPAKADIFKYFNEGLKQTRESRKKISAFGFNFDVIITDEGKGNLLGKRVIKAINGDIQEQGAKVVFTLKNIRYTLQLNPTGNPHELIANMNIHYASNKLPSNKLLQTRLEKGFKKFSTLVKRL